jgi:hypothetical protein
VLKSRKSRGFHANWPACRGLLLTGLFQVRVLVGELTEVERAKSATRVETKHQESNLPVFSFFPRFFRDLLDLPRYRYHLWFGRDQSGARARPHVLVRTPDVSAQNSQSLGLKALNGLTAWSGPAPDRYHEIVRGKITT